MGGGKSGAFFFFSPDQKYLLKSLKLAEVDVLKQLLADYHTHVLNFPQTLLPQFLGFYQLEFYEEKHVFVCMNNLFAGGGISKRYDLKGSTLDRAATVDEKKKSSAVLKDLDIIAEGRQLALGKWALHQLSVDAQFLAAHSLMDYSLLVGIRQHRSVLHPEDSFCFGIIDILQDFTAIKRLEAEIKGRLLSSKGKPSCVDPVTYQTRFIDFMQTLII